MVIVIGDATGNGGTRKAGDCCSADQQTRDRMPQAGIVRTGHVPQLQSTEYRQGLGKKAFAEQGSRKSGQV